MTAARLYVRRPSGVVAIFVAEMCSVESGAVIVRGRWKDMPSRPPREFVWPISRVLEIRREAAAA